MAPTFSVAGVALTVTPATVQVGGGVLVVPAGLHPECSRTVAATDQAIARRRNVTENWSASVPNRIASSLVVVARTKSGGGLENLLPEADADKS
jgi:hypothetical protein